MTTQAALPERRIVRWRPSLAIAGFLLLLAPFLYANPFAGFHVKEWPWDIWRQTTSWDERTEIAGIALVAVLAITSGMGAFRVRFLALVSAFAGFMAIRLHGDGAMFPLLSVERLGLTWFASGLVLGVGLLLLARRDEATRTLGVGLTVVAALAILTFLFAWFPRDPVAQGRSMAEFYYWRVQRLWGPLFQGGESDSVSRAAIAPLIWARVIPTILLGFSVLAALLAAACGAAARWGAARRLAITSFVAYLSTWLVPLGSALIFGVDNSGHPGIASVLGTLGNALLDAGLALWLVLVTSITALVAELTQRRTTGPDVPVPSTPPQRPSIRDPSRVPFAIAFCLGVTSLAAHFHPRHGITAKAWPWDAARSFAWDPAGAALLFHAFFLAVAFAVWVRGISTRTVLWALLGCVAVSLVAFEAPLRDELSSRRFFLRTTAYVPFLLAGIAVGASATRGSTYVRTARRPIALVFGLALIAIVLYPVSIQPDPMTLVIAPPSLHYASALTIGLDSARSLGDFFVGFEPTFGCPFTTAILGFIGVLAVSGAIGTPGRLRRWLTWGLLALATLWPVVQILIQSAVTSTRESSDSLWFALRHLNLEHGYRAAGAVPFFYLPIAWAAAGLVSRAFAPGPGATSAPSPNEPPTEHGQFGSDWGPR